MDPMTNLARHRRMLIRRPGSLGHGAGPALAQAVPRARRDPGRALAVEVAVAAGRVAARVEVAVGVVAAHPAAVVLARVLEALTRQSPALRLRGPVQVHRALDQDPRGRAAPSQDHALAPALLTPADPVLARHPVPGAAVPPGTRIKLQM